MVTKGDVGGGMVQWVMGNRKALVVRSTGPCMEGMNHWILHLKLILHCMMTDRNLNENLRKKIKRKLF